MKRYLFAVCLLVLASCATSASDAPAVLSLPVDATVQQQAEAQRLAASLQQNGKVKVGKGGTLIIQLGGTGNVATPTATDNRKAGSRQGTAAIGRDASASNASRRTAGPPLAVYLVGGLLLVLAGAGGWEWLSHRGLLQWLPWRVGV